MIQIGCSSNKIRVPEVSVKRNERALSRITRRKLQKNCLVSLEASVGFNLTFVSLIFWALSFWKEDGIFQVNDKMFIYVLEYQKRKQSSNNFKCGFFTKNHFILNWHFISQKPRESRELVILVFLAVNNGNFFIFWKL